MIKPKVIIALGKDAAFALLNKTKGSLGSIRGQKIEAEGTIVIPTYHPSYLLRKGGTNSKEYHTVLGDFGTAKELI